MSQDDKSARRRASREQTAQPVDPAAPEPQVPGPEPQVTGQVPDGPAASELAGEELDEAVRAAGVEGRSQMTADEKREALAGVDAEQAGAPVSQGGGSVDKDYLVANARTLLGVEPYVARGALNSSPQLVPLAEAQAAVARITHPDAPVEG